MSPLDFEYLQGALAPYKKTTQNGSSLDNIYEECIPLRVVVLNWHKAGKGWPQPHGSGGPHRYQWCSKRDMCHKMRGDRLFAKETWG